MSFYIFLHGFERRGGAPGVPDEADRVLQPHLRVSPDRFANVVIDDGDAEVFEIERCGGVFEGIPDTKFGPARRYWIEL